MQIIFKTLRGTLIVLDVQADWSIQRVCEEVERREGFPAKYQLLMCGGERLEKHKSLRDYSIQEVVNIIPTSRPDEGLPPAETTGMADEKRSRSRELSSDAESDDELGSGWDYTLSTLTEDQKEYLRVKDDDMTGGLLGPLVRKMGLKDFYAVELLANEKYIQSNKPSPMVAAESRKSVLRTCDSMAELFDVRR